MSIRGARAWVERVIGKKSLQTNHFGFFLGTRKFGWIFIRLLSQLLHLRSQSVVVEHLVLSLLNALATVSRVFAGDTG